MKTAAKILVEEWVENLTEEERAHIANQIAGFICRAINALEALANAAVRAAQHAEVNHSRGALLRVYRQRRKWKTADLSRLNTYRLNKAARKRVAILKLSRPLGPGSTVPYMTLAQQLLAASQYVIQLFDSNTRASERVRLLKQHPSWRSQFIEMTYRGEYQRLKSLGGRSPSEEAERAVADAFYMSAPSVRRECIQARKDPNFCRSISLTVAEFEVWKKCGDLPEDGPQQCNAAMHAQGLVEGH